MAARIVPGAPPPSAAAKKAKKRAAAAASSTATSNGGIHEAATAAALATKAPAAGDGVDGSVQVPAQDLDEEASKGGQPATENGSSPSHKSPLQAVLAKRIKVLNKKLQRIATYDTTDLGKLNADQQRAFASKGGIEMSVFELSEALKGVQIAEAEAKKQADAAQQEAVEAARAREQASFSLLFELVRLFNLFSPPGPPSFAPPAYPRVLDSATGQDKAAVSKLYYDFAASTDVIGQADKFALLAKLSAASHESVIEGVSYQRIHELLQRISGSGSAASISEQEQEQEQEPESEPVPEPVQVQETAPAQEEPILEQAPAPVNGHHAGLGGIHFMQASEIDKDEGGEAHNQEVPLEVKPAEPEGGAVESVPAAVVEGGATDKGESAAKGTLVGDASAHNGQGGADGTANAEVLEPVNTTQVVDGPKKTAAELFRAGPRTFDWAAADDDDLGDLDLQPAAAAQAHATAQAPASKPAASAAATSDPATVNGDEAKTTRGKAVEQKQQQQQQQQQQTSPVVPVTHAKKAPEVDEDGFVVASSKRTKMLQERMEREAAGARGGRGGGRGGGAGRGGGGGGSSSSGGGERRGGGPGANGDRRPRLSGEGGQGKGPLRGGGGAGGGRGRYPRANGTGRGGGPSAEQAA